MSNMKQQGMGLIGYAYDYDGRLPRSSRWMDAAVGTRYIPSNSVFSCQMRGEKTRYGYAMDSRLSGVDVSRIVNAMNRVAVYESTNPAWNAHDPGTSLSLQKPRHRGGNVLLFADGHVQWMQAEYGAQILAQGAHNVGSNAR
jgi:prepilin-type processing-associated H-X9-DG protein